MNGDVNSRVKTPAVGAALGRVALKKDVGKAVENLIRTKRQAFRRKMIELTVFFCKLPAIK